MNFFTKIYKLKEENEYLQIVELMNEYINNEDNKLTPSILDIYAYSLIKLSKVEEGLKIIDKIINLYHNFYTGKRLFDLARRYAIGCQFEKLEEILANNNFGGRENFRLAKDCFYGLNYELAKKLFNKVKEEPYSISVLNKINSYLKNIELYEEYGKGITLPQTYTCFKANGGELAPGHIVKVSKLRNDYIENTVNVPSADMQFNYLIWDIDKEENEIYAFPIVRMNKTEQILYMIPSENYAGLFSDRRIKDDLRVLKITDIEDVTGQLIEDDYIKAIDSVYKSIYLCTKGNANIYNMYFMDEILLERNEDIKAGHIIKIRDFEERKLKWYYVFGIDEENDRYKTFEVTSSFEMASDKFEMTYIGIQQLNFEVFKLNNERIIERLQGMVPLEFLDYESKKIRKSSNVLEGETKNLEKSTNIKTVSLEEGKKYSRFKRKKLVSREYDNNSKLGLIFKHKYDNRIFEILEETEYYYICMDIIPYSNGIEVGNIVYVRKDIPLFEILRIPYVLYCTHLIEYNNKVVEFNNQGIIVTPKGLKLTRINQKSN